MDDIPHRGERGRKGDDSFRALLTPARGPGPGPLPPASSPSGSGPLPSPPSADAAVLALPVAASRAPTGGSPRAMDGAGEAMLVRRSKPKKRPRQAAPAGWDSGSGDRFRALWRDYRELLEDTEAKKNRLASTHRRKLALLAEVKFLRRKYRSFVKAGSQQTHYKLKKQARHIQSPLGSDKDTAFAHHGAETEVPSTSKNPNFDLNQDSGMNDEGNDCQGHRAHPEVETFEQVDVKLSVCRDTEDSPASDGKRSVPWQDRLALKA